MGPAISLPLSVSAGPSCSTVCCSWQCPWSASGPPIPAALSKGHLWLWNSKCVPSSVSLIDRPTLITPSSFLYPLPQVGLGWVWLWGETVQNLARIRVSVCLGRKHFLEWGNALPGSVWLLAEAVLQCDISLAGSKPGTVSLLTYFSIEFLPSSFLSLPSLSIS